MSNDKSVPNLAATIAYLSHFAIFFENIFPCRVCVGGTAFVALHFCTKLICNGSGEIYDFFLACFLEKFQKWSCIHETPIVSFWRFGESPFAGKEHLLLSYQKQRQWKVFNKTLLKHLVILLWKLFFKKFWNDTQKYFFPILVRKISSSSFIDIFDFSSLCYWSLTDLCELFYCLTL